MGTLSHIAQTIRLNMPDYVLNVASTIDGTSLSN